SRSRAPARSPLTTLSLHDALPISPEQVQAGAARQVGRSVQCRQNRRGRTAATWPYSDADSVHRRLQSPPSVGRGGMGSFFPPSSNGKQRTFRPVRWVRRSPSVAIARTLYATAAW